MASIAPEDIYLIDHWPGPYNPNRSIAGEKWDSTKIESGNNCSTPSFPSGTKIMGFTEATVSKGGSKAMRTGGYGMIYTKYICTSTAVDLSASDIVVYACGSAESHGPMACARDITGGNALFAGAVGIACADCTPNSYVWLWIDGVAPFNDATTLDVTGFITSGCVGSGFPICMDSEATRATLAQADFSVASEYSRFSIGMAFTDDT